MVEMGCSGARLSLKYSVSLMEGAFGPARRLRRIVAPFILVFEREYFYDAEFED